MGTLASCCCPIVLIVLVVVGISAGITSWKLFEPFQFKLPNYQVTNVSLTLFNLTNVMVTQNNITTNNTLLQYNLTLNISIQNPNKMVGFHYHRLEAVAIFKAASMNSIPRDPFDLGHKSKFLLGPIVFIGSRWVGLLGDDEMTKLKNARVFDIFVRLYVKYWSKGTTPRRFYFDRTVACPFRVPLTNSTGQSQQPFSITNCIPEKK